MVQHCQKTLLQLIEGGLVDIVACNEEEAETFARVSILIVYTTYSPSCSDAEKSEF